MYFQIVLSLFSACYDSGIFSMSHSKMFYYCTATVMYVFFNLLYFTQRCFIIVGMFIHGNINKKLILSINITLHYIPCISFFSITEVPTNPFNGS